MVTIQFVDWLDAVNPKNNTDYLYLYRVVKRGGNHGIYSRTEKDDKFFIKASNCDLVLKLASEKAIYVFIQALEKRSNIQDFDVWCSTSPKLFRCTDSIEDILNELIGYGLVGISGGRKEVRGFNGLINEEIRRLKLKDIFCYSTYNHPLTELSYPFNINKFNSDEAKSLVIHTYDELNPMEEYGLK